MPSQPDGGFAPRGRPFDGSPFYNCVLAANIAVCRHLADALVGGDLGRVVWSSADMMFRARLERLDGRKAAAGERNAGLLDLPFCAVRLAQDGVKMGSQRQWWNPALRAAGMWEEALGRRLSITPATLTYDACLCVSHDSDLYRAAQGQIWDGSAEALLNSYVDAETEDGRTATLKNIIVWGNDARTGAKFGESDWLAKNRIQTVEITGTAQTWIVMDTPRSAGGRLRWSVTRKVLLDFAEGMGRAGMSRFMGDADGGRVEWSAAGGS